MKPENGTLHICADIPNENRNTPNNDAPNDIEVPTLGTLLQQGFAADRFPEEVLKMLWDGIHHTNQISLSKCREEIGQLVYRNRIYVPNHDQLRLRILLSHHDPPAIGHPGRTKTLKLIDRTYYWPGLRKDDERLYRTVMDAAGRKLLGTYLTEF